MKYWVFLTLCFCIVANNCQPSRQRRDDGDDDDDGGDEEQPKRLVVYYNFEKTAKPKAIADKSGYENSGTLTSGGEILKFNDPSYTCNQGARLWESEILLKGDTFQAKPRTAITIAAWIRLDAQKGQHSIFDTIGASHPMGQYHFEVNNGIVRWFHRNEEKRVIFESMAHTVEKNKWTHIAGTYDSKTKQAKIFINGEIRNQSIGDGILSRDWGVRAGISNTLKCRPLQGSIDEFRIYNYALTPDEIKALVSACKAPDAPETKSSVTDVSTSEDAPEGSATSRSSDASGGAGGGGDGGGGGDKKEESSSSSSSRRKRRDLVRILHH